MNILIVEDDDRIADFLCRGQRAEGHLVQRAADGPTGLARAQVLAREAQPGEPPIVVVLDLMLPGMSGYAVCETLRGRGDTLPVVMLTARTLVEDRIRGFDAGTDVYLQKPFDLEELLSVIRNLLSRRGRDDRPTAPAVAAPAAATPSVRGALTTCCGVARLAHNCPACPKARPCGSRSVAAWWPCGSFSPVSISSTDRKMASSSVWAAIREQ